MINYQWDYESVDEYGDIINHNHADKLADFGMEDITNSLVLVCDIGNEQDGLQERSWAYVVDYTLPEYFSDAAGLHTRKVPAKFHKEIQLFKSNTFQP